MDIAELTWIAWAILGVIFIVAEIFTSGFVLLWFGIGALLAALLGLLGVTSFAAQFMVFVLFSVALTAASRTIFENYFSHEKTGDDLKSGAAALPGQTALVVHSSAGALQEGAVKIFGSTWKAFPVEGETELLEGERVVIERVQGATLYVRRVNNEEPSWRPKALDD